MKFKRMSEVDLRGKRVFIRGDLNVPLEDGRITDDTRIRASVPGIQHALEQGAAVMVTSHLGRPDGRRVQARGFARAGREATRRAAGKGRPSASRLGRTASRCKPGQVVMLENCRFNKGEKKDDEALARKIAALCDVYVNDAFGTAHRAEATTHGVGALRQGRLRRAADGGGARCARRNRLPNPKRPLVAIVAGSKVSTKLTILAALAKKVDALIVGGGIANTFLLAAGKPIGKSLAEPDLVGEAKRIMPKTQVPLPRTWWSRRIARQAPRARSRPSTTCSPTR